MQPIPNSILGKIYNRTSLRKCRRPRSVFGKKPSQPVRIERDSANFNQRSVDSARKNLVLHRSARVNAAERDQAG